MMNVPSNERISLSDLVQGEAVGDASGDAIMSSGSNFITIVSPSNLITSAFGEDTSFPFSNCRPCDKKCTLVG